MDANKLFQQSDRRAEAVDRRLAKISNRKPIPETDKIFYYSDIYYEDALLKVIIIDVREYLNGVYRGINISQRGPWVLFKVSEIIDGDYQGLIGEGSVVLAKWDPVYKVYRKFIYDENPKYGNKELLAITSLINVTESELINGGLR